MKKIILGFFLTTTAFAQSLRSNVDQQFLNAKIPRNYILNSGAEKNDLNITDASSIHSRTTTLPITGFGSHAIDATATSQLVVYLGSALQPGLHNQMCEASFKYNGDASLYTAYATLNGVTVSAVQTLQNISFGSQTVSLNFPCGVSATDVASVVVASTGDGSAIKLDDVYIGADTNIGTVAQAETVVRAYRNSTAQVIAASTPTTVVFNAEAIDQYSEFDTATGIFTAKRAGRYEVFCQLLYSGAAAELFRTGVWYNDTSAEIVAQGRSIVGTSDFLEAGPGSYDLNVGDTIRCKADSTADTSYNIEASQPGTYMEIKRFPTASEQVFRVGAPGSIWTSFTPTLSWVAGISSNTAYWQCSNGTLSVYGNIGLSGAPTAAALTATMPSGMVADTTVIGTSTDSKASLGWGRAVDASAAFGPVEVLYLNTTSVRIASINVAATYPSQADVSATVPFTWASTDNLSYYYSVPVTASSPCPSTPMPLIANAVTTNSPGVESIQRAIVGTANCTGSPCTIASQSGSWLTSITRPAIGTYTLNIATGIFSGTPSCTITASRYGTNDFTIASGPADTTVPSATSYTFKTLDQTATLRDAGFNIICMGPK